jgi:uncharacterized protein (DUF2336 family)
MSASASLIPELEHVIRHGSKEKRAATIKRIANLFVNSAAYFNEDHVGLFDDVLCRLVDEIETRMLAELSQTLAPIPNAPADLMHKFARNDDISVAGPVLTQSPRMLEAEIVELAKTKGQAHLAAIAGRKGIGEAVTDVLVHRGDRQVARNVADNQSARLSEGGYTALVRRAEGDSELAEKVGQRPDIPGHLFRELLSRATAVVQQRLLASAKPGTQSEIKRILNKVTKEISRSGRIRDYSTARAALLEMHKAGKLNESKLIEFAKTEKFEEMVVALSLLCNVSIETVNRLIAGERPDPVLILCRSAGFGWSTAKAIIVSCSSGKEVSSKFLDLAFTNFEKLLPTTARRVVRFWQVKPTDGAAN